MDNPRPRHETVEDYTVPFLVSAAVLCFIALVAVWAVFGMFVAVLFSFGLDRLIAFRPAGPDQRPRV